MGGAAGDGSAPLQAQGRHEEAPKLHVWFARRWLPPHVPCAPQAAGMGRVLHPWSSGSLEGTISDACASASTGSASKMARQGRWHRWQLGAAESPARCMRMQLPPASWQSHDAHGLVHVAVGMLLLSPWAGQEHKQAGRDSCQGYPGGGQKGEIPRQVPRQLQELDENSRQAAPLRSPPVAQLTLQPLEPVEPKRPGGALNFQAPEGPEELTLRLRFAV